MSFYATSTSTPTSISPPHISFPSTPHIPTYEEWPYTPSDFTRSDESDDSIFYRPPRFVTHIDDAAISRLTAYYATVLPRSGTLLDMCTSWKSFYPREVCEAVASGAVNVYGVGLNAEEMSANKVFKSDEYWRVFDLNKQPWDVGRAWGGKGVVMFDAVTCVVSIDYLARPLEVCANLLRATRERGKVHFVVSNRCFPNKVVRKWIELDEQERLRLVGDYLHFSGWSNVEVVDLCARDNEGERITDDHGTVLADSRRWASHLDPLWVVRAVKSVSEE